MAANRLKKFAKDMVADRFGSRRGFSQHCKYSLMYKLGRYDSYQLIDWDEVNRLIFVCKGNICRSAFAEAVAIDCNVNAISCGINTVENASANMYTIAPNRFRSVDWRIPGPFEYRGDCVASCPAPYYHEMRG